jgi:hypothetical protein
VIKVKFEIYEWQRATATGALLFLILITIHYRWINIIIADQPPNTSLVVTHLQRRHCQ